MYTKTKIITPDEARILLDFHNPRNRPISQRTVDRYAQEMREGRWKLNGEAIIIGKSKNILNGQHRLLACVRSGKPFTTLVTEGVCDDTFDTIDDGTPRRLSDVLSINGERNAGFISSALYFVFSYATDNLYRNSRKAIPTKQLLEKLLQSNGGIRESAKYYTMIRKRPGGVMIPPALAVGLHYIFALIDNEKADKFFDQFKSGLHLTPENPIYLLRQRLIAGSRESSNKLRTEAQYIYTVMAWNAYYTGKKMTRMALQPGAPMPLCPRSKEHPNLS